MKITGNYFKPPWVYFIRDPGSPNDSFANDSFVADGAIIDDSAAGPGGGAYGPTFPVQYSHGDDIQIWIKQICSKNITFDIKDDAIKEIPLELIKIISAIPDELKEQKKIDYKLYVKYEDKIAFIEAILDADQTREENDSLFLLLIFPELDSSGLPEEVSLDKPLDWFNKEERYSVYESYPDPIYYRKQSVEEIVNKFTRLPLKTELVVDESVRQEGAALKKAEETARQNALLREEIEILKAGLMDKSRVEKFEKLTNTLSTVLLKIEKIIQAHINFVAFRKPLESIEGRLEELNQVDIEEKGILQYAQDRSPILSLPITDDERKYLRAKSNLQQLVTGLKNLTEANIGKIIYLKGDPKLSPEVEFLIKYNEYLAYPDRDMHLLFLPHIETIGQKQISQLTLDRRVRKNIMKFVWVVHSICEASEKLGIQTPAEIEAFGKGEGVDRVIFNIYNIRAAIANPKAMEGFWIDLDAAHEKIQAQKAILDRLNKFKS